jgi:curli biogenesis system outer membrane secretion channel CsgG
MSKRTKKVLAFQVVAVLLAAAFVHCAPGFYGEARLFEYPTPLVPVEPARATIVPISQKFSMAVFNFIDQTGKAGPVTEGLPDALSTALFQSNRFALYDRGQLRHDDFGQLLASWQKYQKHMGKDIIGEKSAEKGKEPLSSVPFHIGALEREFNQILASVDTVFIGALTEIQGSVITLDYRVINSWSNVVLYAGQHRIGYGMSGREVDFNREDLRRLVKLVVNAFPDPVALRTGQVLVQDGRTLTVDLGKKDKILVGMNALILAPGEQILKTPGGEKVRDVMYLAEAYVAAVYGNSCKMRVFRADDKHPDYRVGDFVKFK